MIIVEIYLVQRDKDLCIKLIFSKLNKSNLVNKIF